MLCGPADGRRRDGRRSPARPSSIARPVRPPKPGANGATMRGKKIKGRKRHLLVDTMGNLLGVKVVRADVSDPAGGRQLLAEIGPELRRLQRVWADSVYRGSFIDWVQEHLGWTVEIVEKLGGQKGFVVLPKRWIVERSLAWLGRNRRLSKDYEARPACSEAMIYLASIHLLLKQLAPAPS